MIWQITDISYFFIYVNVPLIKDATDIQGKDSLFVVLYERLTLV